MNIAIFGAGQLGTYLKDKGFGEQYNITLYSHDEVDITDASSLDEPIEKNDVIINCAAYTDVDAAESPVNQLKCYLTNTMGPMNIMSKIMFSITKKFIHVSTDYVYGSLDTNYVPLTEDAEKNPLNYYSSSKADADSFIEGVRTLFSNSLILRPSWLFGPGSDHNFINKIQDKILRGEELSVVTDQVGSPTSVDMMWKAISAFINGNLDGGTYNIANDGYASRWDVAKFIADELGENINIEKITSEAFERAAKVPLNSCLDCTKLKNACPTLEFTSWQEDVRNLMIAGRL